MLNVLSLGKSNMKIAALHGGMIVPRILFAIVASAAMP